MKKVVVIGGGNGNSTVISSLKNDFDVTAITSMADNGGSTGRLRKEQDSSAVGDIRQCLVALSGSEQSRNLFSYRFKEGELKGHSFGNLFLSSIEKATGDIYTAIAQAKNVLDIDVGDVVPITDDKPQLTLEHKAKRIRGVYEIANTKIDGKDSKFSLEPSSILSKRAKESIGRADLIIIAPGNFYCSIIPALIVNGLAEALLKSSAKKVFIGNLVNFANHTRGFNAEDYLNEMFRLTKIKADILVQNNNYDIQTDDEPVRLNQLNDDLQIIQRNLVSPKISKPNPGDKIAALRSKVSHDTDALSTIITQILRS